MTTPETKKAAEIPAQDRSNAEIDRSIAVCQNRIDSRDIFVATREIIIAHGEEAYRLRLTAQNKLILTK
jgi:hemin uptake protein HemP